jgi:putative hemolysin
MSQKFHQIFLILSSDEITLGISCNPFDEVKTMPRQLTTIQPASNPFSLTDLVDDASHKALAAILEKVCGLNRLAKYYRQLGASSSSYDFTDRVLKFLNIGYHTIGKELTAIPRQGATLVVANHPFGGLEGVIMTHLLLKVRHDVKIMANGFLQRIPELSDIFIGVNPYEGSAATQQNIGPMREAIRWLKQGGLLVMFPAGDVSRLQPTRLRIADNHWHVTMARLLRLTRATVVPVYFDGRNSLPFYLLSRLHPRVQTALLPRELLNKRNRCIPVWVGEAIEFSRLKHFEHDTDMARYFRLRTDMLKNASTQTRQVSITQRVDAITQPIAEPVPAHILQQEINALPDSQRLVTNNSQVVYYAEAAQIPQLLQEIGRLREVTFRAVGEGTGKSVDLELYDNYYQHLFIWNEQNSELVGAYRLGLTDQIIKRYGKKGLYTYSLFKYSRSFLHALNPALEVGRSFIRQEYQRSFTPLLLLWKGIAQFVVRHPAYACLFGPVTISNDYTSLSQQLLIDFLKLNNFDWQLGKYVKPRHPYRPQIRQIWRQIDIKGFQSLEGVSELVSLIEHDNKGVPILLRQYLKLGGRLLGFNVDSQFNDCLDGLILVNLRETDAKILQRYMDKDGVKAFFNYHASFQEAKVSNLRAR